MDIMEQQETVQLGSLPSLQITMGELALKGVKQEDRTTVRNVIYLLHAVKHPERMCVSWSVTNTRTGYEVVGLLVPTKDSEIFKEELDLISLADPLSSPSPSARLATPPRS